MSLLPPVLGTPLQVSSAVPQRLESPSYRYISPHWGLWLTNSVYHPLTSHNEPACVITSIQAPYPLWIHCTVPDPTTSPSRNSLLPSSVSHPPPPTVFPPLGRCHRPLRLYSWRWSSGPPFQTALPRRWSTPRAISGPITRTWHHPCRRGDFGVGPLFAPAPIFLALHHICEPMSHYRIHHHVEEGGV